MDYMEKITDLRARKKDLKDQAAKLVEEDKLDDATRPGRPDGGHQQADRRLEALAKASREGADPVYDGVLHDGEGKPGTAGRTPPSPSLPWGSS